MEYLVLTLIGGAILFIVFLFLPLKMLLFQKVIFVVLAVVFSHLFLYLHSFLSIWQAGIILTLVILVITYSFSKVLNKQIEVINKEKEPVLSKNKIDLDPINEVITKSNEISEEKKFADHPLELVDTSLATGNENETVDLEVDHDTNFEAASSTEVNLDQEMNEIAVETIEPSEENIKDEDQNEVAAEVPNIEEAEIEEENNIELTVVEEVTFSHEQTAEEFSTDETDITIENEVVAETKIEASDDEDLIQVKEQTQLNEEERDKEHEVVEVKPSYESNQTLEEIVQNNIVESSNLDNDKNEVEIQQKSFEQTGIDNDDVELVEQREVDVGLELESEEDAAVAVETLDQQEINNAIELEVEQPINNPVSIPARKQLNRDLMDTLVEQLIWYKQHIRPNEYEQLIVDHAKEDLHDNDYYLFASMLRDHYIETEQFDKLKSLLLKLKQRYNRKEIILEEITFFEKKFLQRL